MTAFITAIAQLIATIIAGFVLYIINNFINKQRRSGTNEKVVITAIDRAFNTAVGKRRASIEDPIRSINLQNRK